MSVVLGLDECAGEESGIRASSVDVGYGGDREGQKLMNGAEEPER